MKTVKPGFYPDMPHSEYLKVEALSNSGLKKLAKTPAHFKAPDKEVSSQQQTIFDFGTAFHVATLEPKEYDNRVIVSSAATISSKDKKDAAKEGKIIIKEKTHNNVQAMAERAYSHPDSSPLLNQGGVTEMSCFFEDPDYGFLCKLRADKITDSQIVADMKSTGDAEDGSRGFGSFFKNFTSLHYHWQAYWYLNGLSIATGIPHDTFAFVAVEKDPPHGLNVFYADKDLLLWAMEEIDPLRRLYAECLEKDKWPCYEPGPCWIKMPAWAKGRE